MSKRIFLAAPIMLALVAGCVMSGVPDGLDLRLTRPSARQTYLVTMSSLDHQAKINQMHSWEIAVRTAAGAPVTNAKIGFDGGMPEHGHGFPTSPRVTAELGEGRYRLDGVKFSMSGWWEMKLTINTPLGTDKVIFNTVVTK